MLTGLEIHVPAPRRTRHLEEEDLRRDYIKAGLLREYKAIGVQIGVTFY